jgi:4-amino-4-deoxy-L-arabinose transferase-like glycosyltransferase
VGALALLLRVWFVIGTRHGFALFGDAWDFDRCAWSLAQGHGYCTSLIAAPGAPSAFRPPGYPFLLAGVYSIAGHSFTAARLLGAALGALSAGLTTILALTITGRRAVALLAGALVALLPSMVALTGAPLSENLFIPLALSITLLALRLDRRSHWLPWALLGLGCGLAALTRTVGALLVLAAIWPLFRGARPRIDLLKPGLALLGGLVVALAPWAIRDAVVLGRFVPLTTQGGYTMVTAYNDQNIAAHTPGANREPNNLPEFAVLLRRTDVSEAEIDSRERSEALSVITGHPLFAVRVTLSHLPRLFYLAPDPVTSRIANTEMAVPSWLAGWFAPTTVVLLGLAIAGLIALWQLRPAGLALVVLVPALLLLGVAPLLDSPRYRIPLDPFLCVFASLAVVSLVDLLRAARARFAGR